MYIYIYIYMHLSFIYINELRGFGASAEAPKRMPELRDATLSTVSSSRLASSLTVSFKRLV